MTGKKAEATAMKIYDDTALRLGDFDEIPANLILFRKGKATLRLPIWKWAERFDREPGEIIAGLHSKIYGDQSIVASLFMAEGWMLHGQLDPQNPPPPEVLADVKRIMNGEIKPSDSEFRVEVLMGHYETRDGHCIHKYTTIVRDPNDETLRKPGVQNVQTDSDSKGRTVGLFKEPKPQDKSKECNCARCQLERQARKVIEDGLGLEDGPAE